MRMAQAALALLIVSNGYAISAEQPMMQAESAARTAAAKEARARELEALAQERDKELSAAYDRLYELPVIGRNAEYKAASERLERARQEASAASAAAAAAKREAEEAANEASQAAERSARDSGQARPGSEQKGVGGVTPSSQSLSPLQTCLAYGVILLLVLGILVKIFHVLAGKKNPVQSAPLAGSSSGMSKLEKYSLMGLGWYELRKQREAAEKQAEEARKQTEILQEQKRILEDQKRRLSQGP